MDEQAEYAKYYENFSELELFPEHILRKIGKYFEPPILDVGCHTGKKARFYYDLGFKRISGCDISKNSVVIAKKSSPKSINFFQHDMVLGPTKTKFNTICSFQTIEHIFNYHFFLKNMYESLNTGGTLVIDTPNACSAITRARLLLGDSRNFTGNIDESHIRFFNKPCLEKAIRQEGFEIVKSFGYNIRGIVKPFEILMPSTLREVIVVIAKKVIINFC